MKTNSLLSVRSLITVALLVLAFGALVAGTSVSVATSNAPGVPNDGTEGLPPGASIQTVLPGMHLPIAMTFDALGRLFYVEKDGGVRLFANGVLESTPVITFAVDTCSERGLLGITLDPNFMTNHYIYVYYTAASGCGTTQNRVARFLFDETTHTGSNPTTIFTSPQSAGNHNGGNIHFGPDGKLYITIGENANPANSQDVTVTNGKIHRINADGTIPADNPVFTQTGALPSLYAMGLRNSFDFSFDPYTAMSPYPRIFASENGPSCDDEMNRIEATYNYGWRPNYPCDDGSPSRTYNTIDPLWYIPNGSCCEAPVGIIVYSGSQIPQWQGGVFMATNSTGNLRHYYLNADRTLVTTTNIVTGVTANMDLENGPDGAFYYMEGGGYSDGTLKRIVGPGGGSTPTATTVQITATRTPVQPSSTATRTRTPAPPTSTRTTTPTGTFFPPSETSVPTDTATATATICPIQFTDVPPGNDFYPYARCLACREVLTGYQCGGPGEPCDSNNNPYFRPYNDITRGQIAKVVSNAAGFIEDPGDQIYADVTSDSPFYAPINRLTIRRYVGGYPCGGEGEPCDVQHRPYFRPGNNATRGQLAKIVSNAAGYIDIPSGQIFEDVPATYPFYDGIQRLATRGIIGGYSCGGEGEPCVPPDNRPYFRPGNDVTRGQAAKIVTNTFRGSCPEPPAGTSNVEIEQFAFHPTTVTVPVGSTVRWYNYDLDYHTATSGVNGVPDGQFDSGNIRQFESWGFTFTTPGTYTYFCRPHPYMVATIIVTP